ncbi:hypothetical protein [Streptomyces deserti]
MTIISPSGIRLTALGAMERQSKVATDTMIMTATRALCGRDPPSLRKPVASGDALDRHGRHRSPPKDLVTDAMPHSDGTGEATTS